MCAEIAEHCKVSPSVELISPACRYLVCDILLDGFPCALYLCFVSAFERVAVVGIKPLVNRYVRRFIAKPLLHFRVYSINGFCRHIKPSFGRKLVQNSNRLKRLSSVLAEKNKAVQYIKCCGVVSVCHGVIVQAYAHNYIVFRYFAAIYSAFPSAQCALISAFAVFNLVFGFVYRLAVCIGNARKSPVVSVIEYRIGHLLRSNAAVHNRLCRLRRKIAHGINLR